MDIVTQRTLIYRFLLGIGVASCGAVFALANLLVPGLDTRLAFLGITGQILGFVLILVVMDEVKHIMSSAGAKGRVDYLSAAYLSTVLGAVIGILLLMLVERVRVLM